LNAPNKNHHAQGHPNFANQNKIS